MGKGKLFMLLTVNRFQPCNELCPCAGTLTSASQLVLFYFSSLVEVKRPEGLEVSIYFPFPTCKAGVG